MYCFFIVYTILFYWSAEKINLYDVIYVKFKKRKKGPKLKCHTAVILPPPITDTNITTTTTITGWATTKICSY